MDNSLQKGKPKQSKPLLMMAESPSTILAATSTPKTIETRSLNSDIRSLYDEKGKQIEENERKMIDCSNKELVNYYIHRNKELMKQLQQSSSSDSLTMILKKIHNMEDHLRKLRVSKIKELDIWPGNRSEVEQTKFKDELIINYQCGNPNYNSIKCMMLNAYFSRDVIRASHIWRYSTHVVA